MPTLPKYRKIKRPTVVIKKKTLKRRSYDKKLSSSSYEKLKNNNIALARALNKQKQEVQYLYRQNINLTAQNQDLQCLRKRHMAAFSGILKSSKEAMDLMVQATEKVVYVISACNDLSKSEATTPRISVTTPNRRESTKYSPNKSPARGVVQPMVSGHAIAQPAITLSRIRIAVAPNVSDIEESSESSPTTPARPHQRISPTRSSRPLNRSIAPLLPQRIRISSPRVDEESLAADESRRHSERRSSRYQKRKSRNSTRHSSDLSRNSINIDATIKSPRVSLEDVSKLMQNSQRINVRNLMEGGNEEETIAGDSESTPPPLSRPSSPTYQFDKRVRKQKQKKAKEARERAETETKLSDKTSSKINHSRTHEDDPLEGTSWSHNNSSLIQASTNETLNKSNGDCLENCMRAAENLSTVNRMSLTMISQETGYGYTEDDDGEVDDDDDDVCRVINMNQLNDSDEERASFTDMISRNVCTSRRGCSAEPDDFDPDDFTMMPGLQRQHKPWTMADLDIPTIEPLVLENPLPRVDFMPEPEMTGTIQINAAAPQPLRQSVNLDLLPNVTLNTSVTMPFIDTAGRESEDETTAIFPAGRRRANKPVLDSSSESDSSSPQKLNNVSLRRKADERRDPKSAKVVLEKLKEPKGKKRPSSPDSRRSGVDNCMQRNGATSFPGQGSDSESSNASVGSKQSSGRPKRQKAPVFLGEPSIMKKLRR